MVRSAIPRRSPSPKRPPASRSARTNRSQSASSSGAIAGGLLSRAMKRTSRSWIGGPSSMRKVTSARSSSASYRTS